jgi:hypothetical protein
MSVVMEKIPQTSGITVSSHSEDDNSRMNTSTVTPQTDTPNTDEVDKAAGLNPVASPDAYDQIVDNFDHLFIDYLRNYGRDKVQELFSQILASTEASSLVTNIGKSETNGNTSQPILPKGIDADALEKGLQDLGTLKNLDDTVRLHHPRCSCYSCSFRRTGDEKHLFSWVI